MASSKSNATDDPFEMESFASFKCRIRKSIDFHRVNSEKEKLEIEIDSMSSLIVNIVYAAFQPISDVKRFECQTCSFPFAIFPRNFGMAPVRMLRQ